MLDGDIVGGLIFGILFFFTVSIGVLTSCTTLGGGDKTAYRAGRITVLGYLTAKDKLSEDHIQGAEMAWQIFDVIEVSEEVLPLMIQAIRESELTEVQKLIAIELTVQSYDSMKEYLGENPKPVIREFRRGMRDAINLYIGR